MEGELESQWDLNVIIFSGLMFHRRAKLTHDPNNTAWTRSTDRYGHRILESQGWQPGNPIGFSKSAGQPRPITFTAISPLHDSKSGLGARDFNSGTTPGLSGFQLILGRLNGKSEVELESEKRVIEKMNRTNYLDRRGVVAFVSGGLLKNKDQLAKDIETPDPGLSTKLAERRPKNMDSQEKKRNEDDLAGANEVNDVPRSNSTRSEEKQIRKLKRKAERKAQRHLKEVGSSANDKNVDTSTEASLKPTETINRSNHPSLPEGRPVAAVEGRAPKLSVRHRQIQQKRLTMTDSKALNEVRVNQVNVKHARLN